MRAAWVPISCALQNGLGKVLARACSPWQRDRGREGCPRDFHCALLYTEMWAWFSLKTWQSFFLLKVGFYYKERRLISFSVLPVSSFALHSVEQFGVLLCLYGMGSGQKFDRGKLGLTSAQTDSVEPNSSCLCSPLKLWGRPQTPVKVENKNWFDDVKLWCLNQCWELTGSSGKRRAQCMNQLASKERLGLQNFQG